jgi:hypothetical protein
LNEFYPQNFHLVNYDDLLKNTIPEIKQLFKFIDTPYTSQTEDFIIKSTTSQSDDAYAVFKKKANDLTWESSLPTFIERAIKNDPDFIELNKKFQWI